MVENSLNFIEFIILLQCIVDALIYTVGDTHIIGGIHLLQMLCVFSLQFKIGLCQLSVTADKERNIAHARLAIEEAAEKGAKLVLLPVIFYYELLLFFLYLHFPC